jgi:hypothetical protein
VYFIMVGFGVGLYYGWWLFRFYPGLRMGRPGAAGKRGMGDKGRMRTKDKGMEAAGEKEAAGKEAGVKEAVFLPAVAGELMQKIGVLFKKAKKEEMEEGELLTGLRRLMGDEGYKVLRGTPFEEKVNAMVVRDLENFGSVHAVAEVVGEMWKG